MACSCGTSVITCDDPNADIYIDDEYIGTGQAEMSSLGPPKTVRVEARRGTAVIGETSMSRKFVFSTVLWGMISYYTGFYWGWYYPDAVYIPLNNHDGNYQSPWDYPRKSIWMQPISRK